VIFSMTYVMFNETGGMNFFFFPSKIRQGESYKASLSHFDHEERENEKINK
jgi:hypothetical protein